MPIILQLSEDIEQENEGDTFCGILTDVENNQIYMEKHPDWTMKMANG